MSDIGPSHARVFDRSAIGHDHPSEVVALHLSYNAVAQVASLPDRDGFLIRVWPSNGTYEYGGTNTTLLSVVIKFDAQLRPSIEHLSINVDADRYNRPAVAAVPTPDADHHTDETQ
jgi:hypothetical protein